MNLHLLKDVLITVYLYIAETKKINMFQAVNDAMSTALETDESAGTIIKIRHIY
jgi:hypothetical protein